MPTPLPSCDPSFLGPRPTSRRTARLTGRHRRPEGLLTPCQFGLVVRRKCEGESAPPAPLWSLQRESAERQSLPVSAHLACRILAPSCLASCLIVPTPACILIFCNPGRLCPQPRRTGRESDREERIFRCGGESILKRDWLGRGFGGPEYRERLRGPVVQSEMAEHVCLVYAFVSSVWQFGTLGKLVAAASCYGGFAARQQLIGLLNLSWLLFWGFCGLAYARYTSMAELCCASGFFHTLIFCHAVFSVPFIKRKCKVVLTTSRGG